MSSADVVGRRSDLLIEPDNPSWDSARQAWNLAVDQHPAGVVLAASVDDVVAAVRLATARGWQIAAQSTGHGVCTTGDLSGTLLVRTSPMSAVEVDGPARSARVGGGAVWGAVATAANAHGLAPLAGSSTDVGVVGYSLGGGLSWLSRKHGLAANSVDAIEIVTPDGAFHRVDAEHEPDLFWALRGGGGSFGVVTAMEFALYPAPRVYSGQLWWPLARAGEVVAAWREWNAGLDRDTSSCVRLLRLPPIDEIPEPLRGGAFAVVEVAHLGDATTGKAVVDGMRALSPAMDLVAEGPSSALMGLHMDPEHPVPGCADGALLEDFPDAAIEALLDAAGPGRETTLLSVELRGLGGAIADEFPEGGATRRFDARYAAYSVGVAAPPVIGAVRADVERVMAAISPWQAERGYLNFCEHPCQARQLWPAATVERLREVAARYDPDGLMRANHPVSR